jgi:hypothetical protein
MGRGEDIFLRIKRGGAAEINQMIADQVVEELFLDYKRAATVAPFQKLDPSDRRNLAKAIAGFANSEGGVVVWGVAWSSTETGAQAAPRSRGLGRWRPGAAANV